MSKHRFEIVPATETGSERRTYSLVGHGPGLHPHDNLRFPTHEAAAAHMEKYGLEHHAPEPPIGHEKGWQW
jgi:hypothetical protein